MKYMFDNIGLIDQAEIELADLTLLCGENNTGKTYLTYGIYGFLRTWRFLLRQVLVKDLYEKGSNAGNYNVDLNFLFSGKLNDYLEQMAEEYDALLPDAFATSEQFFKGGRIRVSVAQQGDWLDAVYNKGRVQKVSATVNR